MTLDEVRGGSAREPRRWVRAVGVLVVVALLVGVAADRWLRSQERSALKTCVVRAEADLDDMAYRTAGLEVYISSAVDRPDIAPSVRRSLRGIVQETVLRGLPALQRDQRRCTSVSVRHGAARTARRDYLAYLSTRLDQLDRAVVDLDALHEVVPGLDARRDRARASLARVGVRLSP